jgi:hypothetical protein
MLRTKSRKGRDLKRLDGTKRRVTRRHRKQRGGATASSVNEWLASVSKLPLYANPPLEEEYKISKAIESVLMLPPYEVANKTSFELGISDFDIRQHAVNVHVALNEIMKHAPTVSQFADEMQAQAAKSTDIQADEMAIVQLTYLKRLENTMRTMLNSDYVAESASSENILSNVKQYPLYIWALYAAAPIETSDMSARLDIPVLTSIPASPTE